MKGQENKGSMRYKKKKTQKTLDITDWLLGHLEKTFTLTSIMGNFTQEWKLCLAPLQMTR